MIFAPNHRILFECVESIGRIGFTASNGKEPFFATSLTRSLCVGRPGNSVFPSFHTVATVMGVLQPIGNNASLASFKPNFQLKSTVLVMVSYC